MNEEEKEAIEQEFQYALDEILSLAKGETATAIVCKEQSMILLFKKLLLKIDKLQKGNEEMIPKYKIKELKEKIHQELDKNGITRAYQITIDKYFDELLEEIWKLK